MLWPALILLFFSIPHSKLIGYILPVFPALSLLVASYLVKIWEAKSVLTDTLKTKKIFFYFIVALLCNAFLLLTLVTNASHLNRGSSKSLVAVLKNSISPQDEIVNYYRYFYDVPLYLGKRVSIVANWDTTNIMHKDNWLRELSMGRPFQNTDDWLINEQTFWQRYESEKRVFVFLNKSYFSQFKARAKNYYFLGEQNNIILLSNHFSLS